MSAERRRIQLLHVQQRHTPYDSVKNDDVVAIRWRQLQNCVANGSTRARTSSDCALSRAAWELLLNSTRHV
jgi:hypothetical protein